MRTTSPGYPHGCALLILGALVVVTASAGGAGTGETRLVVFIGLAIAAAGAALWLRPATRRSSRSSGLYRDANLDEPQPQGEILVTVLEPADPAELAAAEAALRSAGIPFVTQHAGIQDLVGGGQLGGRNVAVGPAAIQVTATDLDRAANVLHPTAVADQETSEPSRLDSLLLLTPFALVVIACIAGLLVPAAWRWYAGAALFAITMAVGVALRAVGRRGRASSHSP